MFDTAREDIRAFVRNTGSIGKALSTPGLYFILSHRLIRQLDHLPVVGKPLRHALFFVTTIAYRSDIAMDAELGAGLFIPKPFGVVIGPEAVIGKRVTIGERVTIGQKSYTDRSIATISDDVVLGKGSVIIGGVSIGRGAAIEAKSVIVRSVDDGARMAGNPAKPAEATTA